MYNEKIKQQFLQSNFADEKNKNSYNTYFAFFNKTYEYENSISKDLYGMTFDELLNLMEKYFSKSGMGARSYISMIRRYLEWCKINKYCVVNWFDKNLYPTKFIIERIQTVNKRYYLPYDKYVEYKNKLLNSVNNIYIATIFMSCYEGIAGKKFINLVHLRVSDIDKDNNSVKLHDGSTKFISSELCKLLIETSNVDFLVNINDNKKRLLHYSLYPDSIWKEYRESKIGNRKFYNAFNNRISIILKDEALTANTVIKSGQFNSIVDSFNNQDYNLKEYMQNTYQSTRYKIEKLNDILKDNGFNLTFSAFRELYGDWIEYIN